MHKLEQEFLKSINVALQDLSVVSAVDEIADRVEKKFQTSIEALAWEFVPIEIYRNSLPESIRSSWVFLLREGSTSGAHRHPNSHQRMRSWRRSGDLQIWADDHWKSNVLVDRFDVPIEQQWVSIPHNYWHQAVVGPGKHWIVISFHTAAEEELIEESSDENDPSQMKQRKYTSS